MPSVEVATPRARLAVMVLVALVTLAMLWPSLRQPPQDSYPLSTYPMFSRDRGRISVIATLVGRTDSDELVRLSPELVGGTDEVMLAVETAGKAARAGSARQGELCGEVAARVAGAGLTGPADPVEEVELRRETYDAVAWFADRDREPIAVDILARCEVSEGG